MHFQTRIIHTYSYSASSYNKSKPTKHFYSFTIFTSLLYIKVKIEKIYECILSSAN